jgi:hypothetical protein
VTLCRGGVPTSRRGRSGIQLGAATCSPGVCVARATFRRLLPTRWSNAVSSGIHEGAE